MYIYIYSIYRGLYYIILPSYVWIIVNHKDLLNNQYNLGGGFKDFLFSSLLGEMFQFD